MLPSDNSEVLNWPSAKTEFKVQKLLVQVSSVTSVAARLFGVQWWVLPDVSVPIPLALALVPVCLNCK